MKLRTYILGIIVLFSAILRLVFLNNIPSGINNDELHFVMNAKAIYYAGSDIEGKLDPFKLAEASSLVFAPIIGPLPTNLFTARLPYALVGCLSVFLIYLITFKLTKNTVLALVSTLAMAINPWSIYVSRTSFDAPVAIFFYLLTIYLLTLGKPKFLVLSIVTGFLAFNSYIGTKVIYLPIIAISSYFLWNFYHKKNSLSYLIVVLFSLVVTLNFVVTLSDQLVAGRVSELQSPNSELIKDQVNLERRQSVQTRIIKGILTNKYTVYVRNFTGKYLYNFSTDILFINGDHATTGSLWKHGYFYYIDVLLILFGIIYLYGKHPKFLGLLAGFILLSPIPEAVRADTNPAYVFHSSFQFPFICIIIGAGAVFFWRRFSNKFLRFVFISVYLLSFANFVDIYFFKAPIYQAESFRFSQRVLAKYLDLESEQDGQIYVLTREPEVMFRAYLFYTNYYQGEKYEQIKNIYTKPTDNIVIDKIHFTNQYQYLPDGNDHVLVYDSINYDFGADKSTLYISNLADTGNIYSIRYGSTCQDQALLAYPNNIGFGDLNLNKLDRVDFCQKYISIKP